MLFPRRALACAVFCISSALVAQSPALDNAAVVKLAKAGLGEDLVVTTINNSPGHYDLSADNMIQLKKDGITDKELAAMLSKNVNPNGPAQASVGAGSTLPAGVDEVGVYYKDITGKWTEFAPEIVNYKSGGALKSGFTYGIVKQDKNGHIPGKKSPTVLTRPITVLIYTSEGTAPNEYQLLKLRENSNNREFRSETGGVIHKSSGAERDRKDFTSTKMGPRLYTFEVGMDEAPGEYGILPPGSITSSNAASAGKIYSFSIKE
ncbi:hypothetical protein ACFQBQ_05950 [Granulicella cerasi]|uniref:Uncharacterized protein n=1 Tax=Granulicella cerasi TaxID=741063 RepID=A0ABW1Z6D7_9BACT|nr:hypothetical protein [Granulicella cerasi]